MKTRAIALILALWCACGLVSAVTATQVEFSAKLERVDKTAPGTGLLVMKVTDDQSLDVRVAPSTEVRDENEIRVDVGTLHSGDTLKIHAIVTDQGFLAVEVEIEEDASEFELKGEVEAVDPTNRTIVVTGVTLIVPDSAEIRDDRGGLLDFSEVQEGWFVKAEGMAGSPPVLSELRALPPRSARIRLEGRAVEANEDRLLVEIPGAIRVPVELEPETEISGSLAVGAEIEVHGRLTPGLTVRAERVEVERLLRVIPDEVKLGFAQTVRVDFALGQPLAVESTLDFSSRNPAIAVPVSSSLILPAGTLTGSLEVMSLGVEGRAVIDVSLTGVRTLSTTLEVEVESERNDEPGDELLEIHWNPSKIISAGPREVRLELNRPAPEDLAIPLSLKEGPAGLVAFPETVSISSGQRVATVPIVVADQTGRAKIRARLPLAFGGDTQDLEVELESQEEARLELEWSPDDLELQPGQQAVVTLHLDRPAPFDIEAVVSVKDGNPGLVMGIPATVLFQMGDSGAQFTISSTNLTGEVRFRAALPVQRGGSSDELRVRVRN